MPSHPLHPDHKAQGDDGLFWRLEPSCTGRIVFLDDNITWMPIHRITTEEGMKNYVCLSVKAYESDAESCPGCLHGKPSPFGRERPPVVEREEAYICNVAVYETDKQGRFLTIRGEEIVSLLHKVWTPSTAVQRVLCDIGGDVEGTLNGQDLTIESASNGKKAIRYNPSPKYRANVETIAQLNDIRAVTKTEAELEEMLGTLATPIGMAAILGDLGLDSMPALKSDATAPTSDDPFCPVHGVQFNKRSANTGLAFHQVEEGFCGLDGNIRDHNGEVLSNWLEQPEVEAIEANF